MYLFVKSPTIDMIACNLQNRSRSLLLSRIRTPYAFVRHHSNSDSTSNRYVTLSDFTLKCIGVFCCISEYNRKKQST